MADDLAKTLLRRFDAMASERHAWEAQWQEIAELINPMRAEFTGARTPGSKRTEKIFDGTAGIAAENLGAGLYGLMTNPGNVWFELRSEIDELNELDEARLWLDQASRRMREAFAANGNRFYNRVIDLYADVVGFGTGVFYVDETVGRGQLHFSCRHLAECYIAENAQEQVDTLFRKFRYTARQAVQSWGDAVSAPVAKAATTEPERMFTFLHAVLPGEEYPGRPPAGRGFASAYVEVESKSLLAEGGYYEFPYMVPRWATRSRAVYGDSQAMLVLPDTKMLNAMSKTTIIGAQKQVDPSLLATDELAMRGLKTSPGQIIYGGLDPHTGRELIRPLITGANVGLGLEMENQRRQAIREGFYASLLLMVQQPNMTATEFLGRQEEKLRLMGPHLGRVQSEFSDPLIDRVFGLMFRGGAFQPLPPSLARYPKLTVRYVSPLARAQKASEANALLRTAEAMTPIASLNPEIWDNFDTDKWARGVADGFGVPAPIMRDPRAVAELRQERSQAQAAAAAAQGAPPVAGALKDAMTAMQTAQDVRQGAAA
jgi:hypothetical protein